MRRRPFVILLGSALIGWPYTVIAQRANRVRRISVVMGTTKNDATGQLSIAALQQGLRELHWIEGKNIQIDIHWTDGDIDKARKVALDIVKLQPDLIYCHAGLNAVRQQSRTIPIVFVLVPDPVGSGYVASLPRPGGNITGFTNFEFTMVSKWLGLLKEIAPDIARVALLYNPSMSSGSFHFRALQEAASAIPVEPVAIPVRTTAEIEKTFGALQRDGNAGLVVLSDNFTVTHRTPIISLAERSRLPAVYPARSFAANGGLISYGPNEHQLFRQSASYVDRILNGAKPSELPVQAPTTFELVVNLKAAKALQLTMPPTLLSIANEVIE